MGFGGPVLTTPRREEALGRTPSLLFAEISTATAHRRTRSSRSGGRDVRAASERAQKGQTKHLIAGSAFSIAMYQAIMSRRVEARGSFTPAQAVSDLSGGRCLYSEWAGTLPHLEGLTIGVTTNRASASRRDAKRMDKAAISKELRESNFERIFLEHYPRVFTTLLRLVGDPAEAEDLALETFWQLHRLTPDVQSIQNPGGWLYRVATNMGLNALRTRKRRERYELQAGAETLGPDHNRDPEQLAAAQEERERVRYVLGQMDGRRSQLLLLRHSGMSYQDLAAAFGVSPNSIGNLLLRAEREFEEKWQKASRAPLPPSPSQAEGR